MQAQFYPTAPHEAGVAPPSTNAEEGEPHVESPGKAKAVLSKVKDKARKLKDKIMKAANTSSTKKDDLNQHTNEEGEGEEEEEADLYEDAHDQDNQVKYEQLRPNCGLDKQGGESEVEVLKPVSAVSAAPGTYWKTENEAAPISPSKSAGPPDAMQSAPIEYRNYDVHDGSTDPHPSLGGVSDDVQVKPSSDYGDVADPHYAQEQPVPSAIPDYAQVELPNTLGDATYPSQVNDPRGKNLEPDSLGFPTFAEEKTSLLSDSGTAEPYSDKELGSRGNSASSDINVGHPEDLVKPNPAFGYPSSPISDKIGVLNEDPSNEVNNLNGGLSTDVHSDGSKENPNLPEQPSINDSAEVQESNNEGWGKWSADKLNNAKDAVATKVGFNSEHTAVGKAADHEIVDECRLGEISNDADKEYCDPNTLKNNKFQEGFSLENEDTKEEVLAGPAIGKLQGLKDTVASSLGYGNPSSADTPHDESSEPAAALEARQATGTGAYAETQSKVECEEMGLSPSQQQTGGALQGLKNAVAAKLGYGSPEGSPAEAKVAMEEPNQEAEARTVSVDDGGDEGACKEGAGKDDHQPSSYAQKLFNTTAAARDYLASKVGYGNNGNGSNDNNAASGLVCGEEGDEKLIIPANVDQLEENKKINIASSLSPNEEDKALSQLITEKVSNTAAALKQKLGNQTPTAPGPHDNA